MICLRDFLPWSLTSSAATLLAEACHTRARAPPVRSVLFIWARSRTACPSFMHILLFVCTQMEQRGPVQIATWVFVQYDEVNLYLMSVCSIFFIIFFKKNNLLSCNCMILTLGSVFLFFCLWRTDHQSTSPNAFLHYLCFTFVLTGGQRAPRLRQQVCFCWSCLTATFEPPLSEKHDISAPMPPSWHRIVWIFQCGEASK